MTVITDGSGGSHQAKVNSEGRLFTNSVTLSDASVSNIEGRLFVIRNIDQTLTSDTESAIFYLKNTGTETMLTDVFTISVGVSTGGTGQSLNRLIRNPLAGTIVDNAVNMDIINGNFGSVNILTADSFLGVEGDTMTGETEYSRAGFVPTFLVAELKIVLPPGSSMGFLYTPPSGNTSQTVTISMQIYLDGFGD